MSPVVNFSTAHPARSIRPRSEFRRTFRSRIDRPALQSNINFLLGRVGSITQGFVQQGDTYGRAGRCSTSKRDYPEIDFYAQDTWKPRSNLTVDLGVR